MLQPARTKYRKMQKGRNPGKAYRGSNLTYGEYALMSLQPGVSVGMTLDELARLLVEFGAVEAINLDGGGSTTMVLRGEVVNKPSDREGERPVSDAILVLPRGRAGAP